MQTASGDHANWWFSYQKKSERWAFDRPAAHRARPADRRGSSTFRIKNASGAFPISVYCYQINSNQSCVADSTTKAPQ